MEEEQALSRPKSDSPTIPPDSSTRSDSPLKPKEEMTEMDAGERKQVPRKSLDLSVYTAYQEKIDENLRLKTKLNDVEAELDSLKMKQYMVEALKTDNHAKQIEIENLTAANGQLVTDHNERETNLRREIKEKDDAAVESAKELLKIKKEKESEEAKVKALQGNLDAMEKKKMEADEKSSRLEGDLTDMTTKKETADAKVAELQGNLESMENKKKEEEEKSIKLESELKAMTTKKDTAEQEVVKLKEERVIVDKEMKKLQEKVADADQFCVTAGADLTRMTQGRDDAVRKIMELEDQIAKLRMTMKTMEDNWKKTKEELDKMTKDKSAVELELQKSQIEIKREKGEAKKNEDALNQRIAKTVEAKEDVVKTLALLQEDLTALQKAKDVVELNYEDARNLGDFYKNKALTLNQRIKDTKKKTAEEKVRAAKKKAQEINAELQSAEQELALLNVLQQGGVVVSRGSTPASTSSAPSSARSRSIQNSRSESSADLEDAIARKKRRMMMIGEIANGEVLAKPAVDRSANFVAQFELQPGNEELRTRQIIVKRDPKNEMLEDSSSIDGDAGDSESVGEAQKPQPGPSGRKRAASSRSAQIRPTVLRRIKHKPTPNDQAALATPKVDVPEQMEDEVQESPAPTNDDLPMNQITEIVRVEQNDHRDDRDADDEARIEGEQDMLDAPTCSKNIVVKPARPYGGIRAPFTECMASLPKPVDGGQQLPPAAEQKPTPAEKKKLELDKIAKQAKAVEIFLKSSNHTQKELEDMLLRCYHVFPFSDAVSIESLRTQTKDVEESFLDCMLQGGKFKEGPLHHSIRKMLGILDRRYWFKPKVSPKLVKK